MIKAYRHATLLVRDIDEAKRFYVDVLGLVPIERPSLPGFPPGAFFKCGDLQLHLTASPKVEPLKSPVELPPPEVNGVSFEVWDRHVAFETDDIWDMYERLKGSNAVIVQAPRRQNIESLEASGLSRTLINAWLTMYGMIPLFCRDPSGNLIEITPSAE